MDKSVRMEETDRERSRVIPVQGEGGWSLQNDEMLLRFSADRQLLLADMQDRKKDQGLLERATPFCIFETDGVEGRVVSAVIRESALVVSWSDSLGTPVGELLIFVEGSSVHWQIDMVAQDRPCRFWFPFISGLRLDPRSEDVDQVLEGESSFLDGQGRRIFHHVDWPLPLVRIGHSGRTLTCLISQLPQAGSAELAGVWSSPGFAIQPGCAGRTVFAAELILHEGGWAAAFDLFRSRVRASLDLSRYERPDLKWFQDQLVHHFTFLYGREILDIERGQFALDRLLDEAERDFGGYDGILIWGGYPRLGVDERTQWDFYDDFPGGRAGLREMARRARERGVRFFIPYKPWDRSAELHGQVMGRDHELLAKLVEDVEADGVLLDTMSAVDGRFREAIDQARPGVVLYSEHRPMGTAVEVITGSWDEPQWADPAQGNWSALQETMPVVDLWRFVLPEHRVFVLHRHAMGTDRIRIIEKGFFNGMGWVVWQDVFGLVLAYSSEEAALLRKCRTVLREHRRALLSTRPTPLIRTMVPRVYANEFSSDTKRLWTFYNEGEERVCGPVIEIEPRQGYHLVDVWNNKAANVDIGGRLHLELDACSVGAVAALPKLLDYLPEKHQVAVRDDGVGAVIELRQPGMVWSKPATEHRFDTTPLLENRAGLCAVRLLSEGELLDQIWI